MLLDQVFIHFAVIGGLFSREVVGHVGFLKKYVAVVLLIVQDLIFSCFTIGCMKKTTCIDANVGTGCFSEIQAIIIRDIALSHSTVSSTVYPPSKMTSMCLSAYTLMHFTI